MTDQEVIETENDLEFIKRIHLWPNKIYLPIKRYTPELECGLIFFLYKTTAILGNLFEFPYLLDEEKLNTKTITYNSIEDLLADGWIVD